MKLPPLELLESQHTFPGNYLFKAIGRVDANFTSRLVAAVRDELRLDVDPPYQTRESGTGEHIAVTLELTVKSAQEVHAVYHRIVKVPGLVLVL